MDSFSELSKQLTRDLPADVKKQQGIYFTPSSITSKLTNLVFKHKKDIKTVLEPSCGSGQFLDQLNQHSVDIVSIEQNQLIFNQLKKEKGTFFNSDFLQHSFGETSFDLVIGNPPYFVIPKSSVDKVYHKYFTGRPNIYVPFILKSFELLNDSGILAFVLPSNFLNCVYYNNLRRYLSKFKVLHVEIDNSRFMETAQPICLFIVEKTPSKLNTFSHFFGDILVFKPEKDIVLIKELSQGSTTISQLGCTMNVGNIVWNQCKKDLTDDSTKTRLIYSGDFKNNVLELPQHKDPSKKHFINKKGSQEKVLLVNRGYGTGKYHLNYCIVEGLNYLVENHCMVISSKDHTVFEKIIKSFENPKTKQFIDLVFSNNAINIEEFMNVVPIFI